jgi:hypothetical protein
MEDHVSEENYNIIRTNVAVIMAEHDDYLDVFVEDMRSATSRCWPLSAKTWPTSTRTSRISCNPTETGSTRPGQEAAAECRENFKHYWGQACGECHA